MSEGQLNDSEFNDKPLNALQLKMYVSYKVNELITKYTEKIDKILKGNGEPGLVAKVSNIEKETESLHKDLYGDNNDGPLFKFPELFKLTESVKKIEEQVDDITKKIASFETGYKVAIFIASGCGSFFGVVLMIAWEIAKEFWLKPKP